MKNRAELDAVIGACFSALPRSAVIERLDAARVAFAGVNTVADLAAHPHLRRISVEAPGRKVSMPAPPVRTGEAPTVGPAPALGAHSAALRREFGGR